MLAPRVKLHSTPLAAVRAGVAALALRPGDAFVDVGCGDGRVLVAAGAAGCECVGLEIDAARAAGAAAAAVEAGLSPAAVRVVVGNALEHLDLVERATAVWLFLVPHGLRAVAPSLSRGPPKRVATYLYPIPGVEYRRVEWVLVCVCRAVCACGNIQPILC
jgi:SAM-dependent methyltransferase